MPRKSILPIIAGFATTVIVFIVVLAFYNAPAQSSPISKEVEAKEQIRLREDIKKQQELLVEETYLLEEKSRFEAEIESIETRLETVRSEKTSFR